MTIADNLQRIKNATDNIREIVDACVGVEDTDKVETYPNKLASAIVDTPTEREITTEGVQLEGINNGVAYIAKIKGKTIVQDSQLISFNGTAIQSKDDASEVISTLPLNISTILNTDGTQLFPYGLCSVGSVYDEITPTKAIKRVGCVDMGTLGWSLRGSTGHIRWYTRDLGNKVANTSGSVVAKAICLPYTTTTSNIVYSNNTDKVIGLMANDEYVSLYDSEKMSMTASQFKAAMNGVMLYYELATPIEVDLTGRKHYYKVENGGSESIVADGLTTPLRADIGYRSAMSAEELVTTLNETLNS